MTTWWQKISATSKFLDKNTFGQSAKCNICLQCFAVSELCIRKTTLQLDKLMYTNRI